MLAVTNYDIRKLLDIKCHLKFPFGRFTVKLLLMKNGMLMRTIFQSRSNALGYNKPCPRSIFAAPLLAQEVSQDGAFTNGLSVMVIVPKCQSHIPIMQGIIDKFLMGSEAKNI